ncbi:MAG: hypothetical protein QXF49_00130 [Thermosphaera sp.]
MSLINPLYNAICFGTLMSAIDKIGIPLPLVARQASEILAPIVKDLAKTILGNEKLPEKLSELMSFAKEVLERNGVAEKIEMRITESQVKMRILRCMYLDVAGFSKTLGYSACPICLYVLMFAAALSAIKLAEVSKATFENNGSECNIELTLLV